MLLVPGKNAIKILMFECFSLNVLFLENRSFLVCSLPCVGIFLFFSDELFFFDGVTSGLFLISHVNIRLGVGFIRSCLYGEVGAY